MNDSYRNKDYEARECKECGMLHYKPRKDSEFIPYSGAGMPLRYK